MTGVGWSGSAIPAIMACCSVMCSAGALHCGLGGTHCASRKRRVNAVRRLRTVVEGERTLPESPKTRLHLVLTQCANIDSRADRTCKPCLLLSCYQAVGGLRLAGPALSFAKPPSDKNQDKQNASSCGADLAPVDIPGLCRPQMQLMFLSRSRTERRSCRGCAGYKQFGCRKEPGRPVPIGRDNVRYCGQRTLKLTSQNRRD